MADGDEGFGYWSRWQVPFCALIIVGPAMVAVFLIKRAKVDALRAVDLWIPCWRSLHPAWLLAFRFIVSLFMSWFLWQMVLVDGVFAFYFYTQWTFTLVIVYFVIGTFISARGCWIYSKVHAPNNAEASGLFKGDVEENKPLTLTCRAKTSSNATKLQWYLEQEEREQRRASFWGYAMQVIYQTSAGAVVLTDVVFWGLLLPFTTSEHFRLNLVMCGMHTLNALFLLLDTALNSLPFPWFRMAYFVLWSCVYVTFQWVLHACGFSWWPYPFLELATPWAPFWYLCMALVHIPCYAFYATVVKAKNSFFMKYFPNEYINVN